MKKVPKKKYINLQIGEDLHNDLTGEQREFGFTSLSAYMQYIIATRETIEPAGFAICKDTHGDHIKVETFVKVRPVKSFENFTRLRNGRYKEA